MRRPKKTVTINLSDYLSAGTYNVKVKSKGTDIRDSADSNIVECVVGSSGYVIDFSGITLGSIGDRGYLTIYDGQNDSGELLYEKSFLIEDDPTNLTTLTFTSGYFYIKWYGDEANGLQNLTVTGDVVITSSSSSSARTQYATGTVSGSGSISGQLSIV